MKRTQLFTKTRKETPADETSHGTQLLIRAGYIHKEMAGVYTMLPLGRKVLNNIVQIIREEMDAIGSQEVSMTSLQDKEIWEKSERWDSSVVDVWFKTKLQNDQEIGLAWSHEEPMTRMASHFINSHKDLPVYIYQFQNKLRNEVRAKSGLLRSREFLMKDLYSFSVSRQQHEEFYNRVADAYMKIYDRLGLGEITYKTFASGGAFAKFSDEFQTISDIGEDTIYVNEKDRIAINKEVFNDEVLVDLGYKKDDFIEKTAVEVGNIFTLGSRFSEPLNLYFTDEEGNQQPVFMGSYGIGPSRVMGLLAEHFADDKGLVWPESVAPAKVYLAQLGQSQAVLDHTNEIYERLTSAGAAVIYDDRDVRAGEMFADADLLGIPYRLIISDKTLQSGQYELKVRSSGEVEMLDHQSLIARLAID